jgi:hypothetical protein
MTFDWSARRIRRQRSTKVMIEERGRTIVEAENHDSGAGRRDDEDDGRDEED